METLNLDPPEPMRRAVQKRVDALLLEGLDSGEPIPATDEFWEQKKRKLVERFGESAIATNGRITSQA